MEKLLLWTGRAAGATGAVATVVAIGARGTGLYFLGGLQAGTLLLAGCAAMVLGCLCLAITARPDNGR